MNLVAQKKVSDFFLQFPQKTYPKGSILFSPKVPISSIHYIAKGVVRMYIISLKGNEVTVNLFGKGAFIPIGKALSQTENMYYYEAFNETTVRRAPVKRVLEFLQNDTVVLYDLLKRIYKGMEQILMQKEYLVEGNSSTKLAYVLLMLSKRFGEVSKNNAVALSLELDEIRIASIAGLARETVSRELGKLQEKGIIDYKKKRLIVNNVNFLEEMIKSGGVVA